MIVFCLIMLILKLVFKFNVLIHSMGVLKYLYPAFDRTKNFQIVVFSSCELDELLIMIITLRFIYFLCYKKKLILCFWIKIIDYLSIIKENIIIIEELYFVLIASDLEYLSIQMFNNLPISIIRNALINGYILTPCFVLLMIEKVVFLDIFLY